VTNTWSPDTQPLAIPLEIVASMRRAAYHELARAGQEIVAVAQTPGHLAHPEWYGDAFAHLDGTRALLNDLGWADTDTPSELRLSVSVHGASLLTVIDRVRICLNNTNPSLTSRLVDDLQSTLREQLNVPVGAAPGTPVRPRPATERTRLPLSALTPRETEILGHLSRSRSYDEIAAILSIDIETVRTHARRVRRKLGLRTSRELIGVYVPEDARGRDGT
jgi:DNA-binding CsgD family transcriptional regulator